MLVGLKNEEYVTPAFAEHVVYLSQFKMVSLIRRRSRALPWNNTRGGTVGLLLWNARISFPTPHSILPMIFLFKTPRKQVPTHGGYIRASPFLLHRPGLIMYANHENTIPRKTWRSSDHCLNSSLRDLLLKLPDLTCVVMSCFPLRQSVLPEHLIRLKPWKV